MHDASKPPLLQRAPADYGPAYNQVLFDQYRQFVESADRISTRRVAANSYMMTVNSFLVSLAGLSMTFVDRRAWTVCTAGAGVLVSVIWALTITSHARLNTAKFSVIHEFERSLPAAPYTLEWHEAARGAAYQPVSRLERAVPLVFLGLYAVLVTFALAGSP